MAIPDKQSFMDEVNKFDNEFLRNNLIDLYDHLKGYKKIHNVKNVIKNVLEGFFLNKYYPTELLIPYKFLDTPIGEVIFTILFGMHEVTYTMTDLRAFTVSQEKPDGYTKQYLASEIRKGNLKASKQGNQWIFNESDVLEFLSKKGFDIKK